MADDGSQQSEPRAEAPVASADAEPEIPGTLFLTTLLLVMIFGFWVLMYWTLLHR